MAGLRNRPVSDLYQTLPIPTDRRCIRLFTVQACDESKQHEDAIVGTMHVADLEDSLSFTALSYVWGQRSSVDPQASSLLCAGFTIPITPNCYLALIHLRRKLGTFTIWIDAVCINQTDEDEKSLQIPLLGDIYKYAREVFVWLGRGNEATDRAMAYLATAGFLEYILINGDSNGQMHPKPQVWAGTWFAYTSFCKASTYPFPFLSRDLSSTWDFPLLRRNRTRPRAAYASYYDLDELLTREWTRRIWTYQEIMLARNPILVCGNSHISWDRFAFSILFLDHVKPKRLANLGIPVNLTIRTWKRIVLTRIRLMLDSSVPNANSDKEAVESRSKIEQKSKISMINSPLDLQIYRRFLFDVFSHCLLLCRIVVAFAYLSLANILIAIVVAAYLHSKRADQHHLFRSLHIYASVSSILFVVIWAWYWSHTYFYYYKTLFGMVPRRQWLRKMKEDTIDDFIDAIITRKATDPKDMAFGLQSVLSIKLEKYLPPPDYAASLGETYRQLTTQLLHTTDHLQFLLPAAGKCVDGQPSWIPDWSANFPNYWLQPFATKSSTFHHHIHKYKADRPTQEPPSPSQPQQLWRLSPADTHTLTIYAHTFCTISETLPLRRTSSTYFPAEDSLHLENIRILLSICSQQRRVIKMDFFANRLNFPGLSPDANPDHLRMYWLYLWTWQKFSPERVLRHLVDDGRQSIFPMPYGLSMPFWLTMSSQQLFSIHIAVCNDIVQTKRRFFTARFPGQRNEEIYGISSTEARIGDRVVSVPGLPSMLVLREKKDEGVEVKLVSPAVVFEAVDQEVARRIGGKSTGLVEILEPFVLS